MRKSTSCPRLFAAHGQTAQACRSHFRRWHHDGLQVHVRGPRNMNMRWLTCMNLWTWTFRTIPTLRSGPSLHSICVRLPDGGEICFRFALNMFVPAPPSKGRARQLRDSAEGRPDSSVQDGANFKTDEKLLHICSNLPPLSWRMLEGNIL